MKKLLSLVLLLAMLCTSALAYSPEEPITITFWHTRGSGANQEVMKASVDAFNATVGKERASLLKKFSRVPTMITLPRSSWAPSPATSRSLRLPLPLTPPSCWMTN